MQQHHREADEDLYYYAEPGGCVTLVCSKLCKMASSLLSNNVSRFLGAPTWLVIIAHGL